MRSCPRACRGRAASWRWAPLRPPARPCASAGQDNPDQQGERHLVRTSARCERMGMLPTLQPGLLLGRCPALPPQLLASGGVPGRHAAACAGDATAPQPIGNRVFPHVCAARAYACEPGAKLGAGTDAQLPVDARDLAQPLREDRILHEAPRHRRSHPQPVRRVRPASHRRRARGVGRSAGGALISVPPGRRITGRNRESGGPAG